MGLLILPQYRPYIEKGEIANLPSYRFYMKIGALNPEQPMSGITVPVKISEDQGKISRVIESSRSRYARKYFENESVVHEIQKNNPVQKRSSKDEALP